MESSAHDDDGFPIIWEDRAPLPPPNGPYVQGINIPPNSPQTFSEYFLDTLSTSTLPQDPMDFMMFQLSAFSNLETSDYVGSLPTDPPTSQQQFVTLPIGLDQHQGISSSVSVAAAAAADDDDDDDASQTHHQRSKPLSRHQIYRMNVKGKAKFKNLSHLILNEHIKMLNEELLRMASELKTKDEEIQMLKEENKRLKLPPTVRNL